MAGRFERSMQLFSASWSVLREDKRLIVFPIISAAAGLAIVAVFAIPILIGFVDFSTTPDAYGNPQSHVTMHPMGWVLTAVGYVVAMYVGTFMNAALIVAANERLTGTGPGSVSSGFRGASAKAGSLAGWVLVAATVGLILRGIEQRLGLVGRIVIGLIGIAWSLVTFLVVPVLVLEDNSTGAAISRSAKLFKDTWGENVIGNVGLGLFSLALVLSAMGLFFIGLVTGTAIGIVAMGVIAFAWLVIGAQALAAMSGIYRVALYRYAVDGQAPQAFATFDFYGAFRPKKTSGLFSSGRTRTIYRSTSPYGAQPRPGETRRDPWQPWQPPAPEAVHGEFGIEIPGADTLPGHGPTSSTPVVPPPPPPPGAPGAGGFGSGAGGSAF